MKKVIILALLCCFLKTYSQVRVKTDDGKIIELKPDGSWSVVGQSEYSINPLNSNNSNPNSSNSKNSNTTSSNTNTNVLDCNEMSFGNITFNNQLNSPVIVKFFNAVIISLNYEYGIEGSQYKQYRYFYSQPIDQFLTIRPNSSSTIYNIRSGVYNYGVWEEIIVSVNSSGRSSQNTTLSERYSSEGNLQITNCSDIQFDIKK